MEDRLGRILERAGFSGFEGQQPIDIGPPYDRTVPDFVYDDDGTRIAVFLDGLSRGIHGSERAQLQDAVIRDQLADQGWEVIAIAASHLDDPELMLFDLKKVARALDQRDRAEALAADRSWFDDEYEEQPGPGLLDALESELELVRDEQLRQVIREAVECGAPVPEIGPELTEAAWPVEAAWPDRHVAIVLDADPAREADLAAGGWRVLVGKDLSVQALSSSLGGER